MARWHASSLLATVFLGAGIVACADADRPPAIGVSVPVGAVAQQPEASTEVDSGAVLFDGGACGDEPFDIDTDASFGGPSAITGTIQLPAVAPANTLIVVVVDATDTTRSARLETKLARATDRVTYRIRGLLAAAGADGGPDGGFAGYLLRAGISQAGSLDVGESGDLDGFYDGTSSGAIFDRATAKPFAVTGACATGLDFGLGVRP